MDLVKDSTGLVAGLDCRLSRFAAALGRQSQPATRPVLSLTRSTLPYYFWSRIVFRSPDLFSWSVNRPQKNYLYTYARMKNTNIIQRNHRTEKTKAVLKSAFQAGLNVTKTSSLTVRVISLKIYVMITYVIIFIKRDNDPDGPNQLGTLI